MRMLLVIPLLLCAALAARAAAPPPVELTYLGLDDAADPDGTRLRFKVNAPSVAQVDVELSFVAGDGKPLGVETYAWQNIVKSKRQPIAAGTTYETDRGPYVAGAARADAKLLRVIFADGTRWSAR